MPDANGRFLPTFYSLSAERWERIFGRECPVGGNCSRENCTCLPEIVWTPDPSLDGAHFTPE